MTTQLERNLISRKQLEDIRAHGNYDKDVYLDKYISHYDGEYQDVFGQTPLNREAGYSHDDGHYFYIADVVPIDEKFVQALNDDLPQDNAWRQIMDTNKDNKLSTNEVRDFFDNFTNRTNKLSDVQLDNLFYLKNNALCLDSLFGNLGCIDEKNVVGRSIITKNDFDILDEADGKKDGIIHRGFFEVLGFDPNEDGVVEDYQYHTGMKKVRELWRKEKQCDDDTANKNLNDTSTQEPEIG